jgi:hypothetical protein
LPADAIDVTVKRDDVLVAVSLWIFHVPEVTTVPPDPTIQAALVPP